MRRWPLLAGLMIATLLLTGCAARLTQLDRFVRQQTRRVSNEVQVQTDLGPLKLYRVTTLGQCGEGYSLAGLGAEGTTQCGREEPVTMFGSGGGGYVMLMGAINDPQITQIKLALADGRELQAQVADGLWYLLLPGQQKIPDGRPIGLDASGNQRYPKGK